MRPDIKSTQLGGIANLALVAPVRPGFIPGADTHTYAKRLEALFKTLMAIRLGARESSKFATPFPDAVGRLGILQSFRYALIPPRVGSRGEAPLPAGDPDARVYRLYLNVVFDGGWEPYLRVIYRDLGYLLDTIFCNCVGYRISTQYSHDEYIRWVREHEVPAGILYAESAASVLDQRYLETAERVWRHEPDAERARRTVAGLALPPIIGTGAALQRLATADDETRREVVVNNLRALKGLYDLRALYPANGEGDEDRLHRFAQHALPEFCEFLRQRSLAGDAWLGAHADHVKWVLQPMLPEQPPSGPPAAFDAADIQSGIHERQAGVTHGCLLLLRVADAAKARAWIAALPAFTSAAQAKLQARPEGHADERLHWNIAFTASGLRALGQPAETVDLFPQEFLEGMEVRAGLLGDVRGNHPEHWRRPRLPGTQVEVDLASVHAVVQFRLATRTEGDRPWHSALRSLADSIGSERDGLLLLACEPMRSYPAREGTSVEHFGFQDGFSQPKPKLPPVPGAGPAPIHFDDEVGPGEIFLGHPGDRDRGRFPDRPAPLLDNGSFLVLRKIRQQVGRWQAMLDRAALRDDPHFAARPAAEREAGRARIASMLMGRHPDGTVPLDPAVGTGNNFNYDSDPTGSRCPFQAHIRRANPRLAGGQKMPRILRRGMSYGPRFEADPVAERGLYFMAYCGSIAEQFEIIQRWMAGGNSSGLHSSHSDAMLGVPQKGLPRSFQWLGSDGRVHSVDLGDEPMTSLEWGLYLFAPSLAGLRALAVGPPQRAPAAPVAPAAAPALDDLLTPEPKRLLQGHREDRDAIWRRVRESGAPLPTPYGLLECRKDEVLRILGDGGTGHSVCGYGRRFAESVGPGFLGMDDPEHQRLAVTSGIKQAIAAITEEKAFDAARGVTQLVLDRILTTLAQLGQPPTVDLLRLSEQVIAGLYKAWWGLPDDKHMLRGYSHDAVADDAETARCPRDFVFVARNNFGAHPTATERQRGTTRGRAIERAVRSYLEATDPKDLIGLSKFIHTALSGGQPGVHDEVVWTIGGTMLGFGPSTFAHFALVTRDWVEPTVPCGTTLWDLQAALLAEGAPGRTFAGATKVMRTALVAQMCREPVPGIIWREAPGSKLGPDGAEPPKTALGLHGLMDDADAEALMFGGTLQRGDRLFGVHACPGHGMAIGVLLGVISTLLLAGNLRRTPSPSILMVER